MGVIIAMNKSFKTDLIIAKIMFQKRLLQVYQKYSKF